APRRAAAALAGQRRLAPPRRAGPPARPRPAGVDHRRGRRQRADAGARAGGRRRVVRLRPRRRGRRAAGAGVVHLRPTVVREVGVVAASEPAAAAARAFVEAARAETAGTLLPSGHPRLDGAVWLSGRTILRASPGAPQVEA